MSYKTLIMILDGVGDRPHPQLNGQTPLQYADIPQLDALASSGQTGLMAPVYPGIAVETHNGVAMIMGQPANQAIQLARGPVELAGIGEPAQHGELIFRANFATLEETASGLAIKDRRAGRIEQGTQALCDSLSEIKLANGINVTIHPATQHRCVARLYGNGLSAAVSNTDPGGKNPQQIVQQSTALEDSPNAHIAAQAINEFSQAAHEILRDHPLNRQRERDSLPAANGIILRSPGMGIQTSSILNDLLLKVAVISGEKTIIGLANLFNFTPITHPSFTSKPDTDIAMKFTMAAEALEQYDLVYLHLKGTDTAAHDKQPLAKVAILEKFDQALASAMESFSSDTVLAVCADHSTDCISGEHNGDDVPVLLHYPNCRRDNVHQFDEMSCSQGNLLRVTGNEFLSLTLDGAGAFNRFDPRLLMKIMGIAH